MSQFKLGYVLSKQPKISSITNYKHLFWGGTHTLGTVPISEMQNL